MRGIALHYCLAGVHPRQHLPGSRIKCGMTVRCAAVPLRLSVRPPFFYSVIPASEPESWAALCAVLRCTIASPVSIPAAASQGPVSEHGVTVLLRRLCCFAAAAAIATACASLLVSLMRQLGGGSAIRASTIALTLHQLFGSVAGMTVQKGRAGGKGRCEK